MWPAIQRKTEDISALTVTGGGEPVPSDAPKMFFRGTACSVRLRSVAVLEATAADDIVDEIVRFEGESDPDDEAVLFALRSRDDKARGTFVAADEGTYAAQVDALRADKPLGTGTVHVRAAPGDAEYFDASMQEARLRRIADETGGTGDQNPHRPRSWCRYCHASSMQAREIGESGSVRSRSRAAAVNGIPTVGRPASVLIAAPSSFRETILENRASNTGAAMTATVSSSTHRVSGSSTIAQAKTWKSPAWRARSKDANGSSMSTIECAISP